MPFKALRELLVRRRVGKDLIKMLDLNELFVDQVQDLAKKIDCGDALDHLETLALGTFLVSEIYLDMSRNKALASDVLDEFHRLSAEMLFNMNLPLLQRRFPGQEIDALYEQAITLFFETAKERYPLYRGIIKDDQGQFKFSPRHFEELGQNLMKWSKSVDPKQQEVTNFSFGLAALDHMNRLIDTFKP